MTRTVGATSDPGYDLISDFDLIASSFLSQYGIRLYSTDIEGMRWIEFKALLSGLNPDTPLGRVVSIRLEEDPEIIRAFTPEQKRMRSAWRLRPSNQATEEERDLFISQLVGAFK